MGNMTKYRVVLDVQAEGRKVADGYDADDLVWFEQSETNRPARLSMSRDTWEDMGSPQQITMTAEPGDHLNGSVHVFDVLEEEADLAAVRDMASRGVSLLQQDALVLLSALEHRDEYVKALEATVGELRGTCTKASQMLAPHSYTEAASKVPYPSLGEVSGP